MSVRDAVLFYSKFDKKSLEIKHIIDTINADIDTISVDNPKIKDLLSKDTKCNIDEVPTIVVSYTDGGNKIYTGRRLDSWFQQLLENIQSHQVPHETEPQLTPIEESFTPLIDISEQPSVGSGMETGVSPIQSAIAAQHIVGSGSNIEADPHIQSGRKEVKKDGMSAAEIAKQMAQQREAHDEKIDQNKPFM